MDVKPWEFDPRGHDIVDHDGLVVVIARVGLDGNAVVRVLGGNEALLLHAPVLAGLVADFANGPVDPGRAERARQLLGRLGLDPRTGRGR